MTGKKIKRRDFFLHFTSTAYLHSRPSFTSTLGHKQ